MWIESKKYKKLGEILTDAREEAGFKQQELADGLGKPQSFVSSYERGQRRLDLLEFLRVMETIGTDPVKVFERIAKAAKAKRKLKRR